MQLITFLIHVSISISSIDICNFKNALVELHKKLNKPCVMGDISESLEYFCTTVKQRMIEKYVENVIRKTFLHKAYSTVWNISTLICHKRTYQILLFLDY